MRASAAEVACLPGEVAHARQTLEVGVRPRTVVEGEGDVDAELELPPYGPLRRQVQPARSAAGVCEVDDLLVALREGARTPEELASQLQRPVPGVLATLARLEVDGLVRRYEGANYALMAR